jgi:hypothetical protein
VFYSSQFKHLYSHLKYPSYGDDDPFEGTSISKQAKKKLKVLLDRAKVRVGIEDIKKGETEEVDLSDWYVY